MIKTMRAAKAMIVVGILTLLGGCAWFGGTEAVIGVDGVSGTVPLTVSFDGTASGGSCDVTTYHWAFGTDDESYEASGTYTYQEAGTFTLTLFVRDENGNTDTASIEITVSPAFWVADENLDCVFRLDMEGNLLDTFNLPATQPHGVTLAEIEGETLLVVTCANDGFQRLVYLDPVTGATGRVNVAPAHSPLQITYGAKGQKQLWHVDGLARAIYRLNLTDAQVLDSFGQSYFKATSPVVRDVAFLWTPQGLDWTEDSSTLGVLWYLEGETHLLYKIEMTPGYDIQSTTQLQINEDPVEITSEVFPVAAIDFYDGRLWVIDVNRHRLVEIDPDTGEIAGTPIYGFPGSAPAGLEIQQ